ncbi:WXG100 family type VII secretion target [Streptomyces sp. NPDC047022]|uniref:WXG100 family type VII secretion target n=1 Tax=Streptomyces sp. NPDC047022 TaxID=3155737 RepID=UPI0033EE2674
MGKFESIKSQLSKLQGIIDSLEGNWKGIGANAFNNKQVEINEHMGAIGKMLMDFVENVQLTKKDKQELESEIHSTIGKIEVQSALQGY